LNDVIPRETIEFLRARSEAASPNGTVITTDRELALLSPERWRKHLMALVRHDAIYIPPQAVSANYIALVVMTRFLGAELFSLNPVPTFDERMKEQRQERHHD
jgi:hypothetical protein